MRLKFFLIYIPLLSGVILFLYANDIIPEKTLAVEKSSYGTANWREDLNQKYNNSDANNFSKFSADLVNSVSSKKEKNKIEEELAEIGGDREARDELTTKRLKSIRNGIEGREKANQEKKEIIDNNKEQLGKKEANEEEADITFSFPNVKLGEFARFVANLNKKILIGEKLLQGNITIKTPKKLTLKKLMEVFKALLNSKGLDYVISGNYLQVFQKSDSEIKVYQINYLKSADIAKTLSDIFKMSFNVGGVPQRVMINSLDEANAVLVLAPKQKQFEIEKAIKELDWRRRQVLLDILIIEVTYNSAFGFGLTGGVKYKDIVGGVGPNPTGWTGGTTDLPSPPVTTPYTGLIYNNSEFFVELEARQYISNFDVLTQPTLLTAENQKAELKVTNNTPVASSGIQISTDQNTKPEIEWKDIGFDLKITPQVNADRQVNLDLDMTITSILEYTTINMAISGDTDEPDTNRSISYPVIGNRVTKTSATVKDNETLVLGGIMQGTKQIVKDKVPFFGELPHIGWLFTTERENIEQIELMMLITPHVIENVKDAEKVTKLKTKKLLEYDKRKAPAIKKMLKGERDNSWNVFNVFHYFTDEPYREEQDVVPQSWLYPDS